MILRYTPYCSTLFPSSEALVPASDKQELA